MMQYRGENAKTLMGIVKVKWSEVKSLSRVQLFVTHDCSPPSSFVHGILQARVLEWVAISFSNEYKSI